MTVSAPPGIVMGGLALVFEPENFGRTRCKVSRFIVEPMSQPLFLYLGAHHNLQAHERNLHKIKLGYEKPGSTFLESGVINPWFGSTAQTFSPRIYVLGYQAGGRKSH